LVGKSPNRLVAAQKTDDLANPALDMIQGFAIIFRTLLPGLERRRLSTVFGMSYTNSRNQRNHFTRNLVREFGAGLLAAALSAGFVIGPFVSNAHAQGGFGLNPIIQAIKEANTRDLKTELGNPANSPNARDARHAPALVVATKAQFRDGVVILLQANARPDATDEDRNTALCVASRSGYAEIVRILILAKADTNKMCENGQTALVGAVIGGHHRIVQQLIDANADLSVEDYTGNRAITYADYDYNRRIIGMLEDAGATR
jgi:hypothetical protein